MIRLKNQISRRRANDTRLSTYYEGTQRLKHLGLAVPAELRQFETVINVPRMAVDEVERRLDVRSLIMPGAETDDPRLRLIYDANNLDAQLPLAFKDALIYGRSFLSIAGGDDPEIPSIMVEPAPDVAFEWDPRRREISRAVTVYRDDASKESGATYYDREQIAFFVKEARWELVEVVSHKLGCVPLIPLINRPRAGSAWIYGTSEMVDVIGLTDSIARTITNMQVALETHSVPQKYVAGASEGDFVDKDGKPKPVWESYFSGIWAIENEDAKFGTFTASSMTNFYDAVNNMLAWCASSLGLPTRYAGQQTVNPAAEGAIKADESRLVKNCERKQVVFGDAIGRVLALAYMAGGYGKVDANRVGVTWHDASTPTFAQKADALQKLAGGIPIISREGAWDQLGFSEAQKQREREYFLAQDADPVLSEMQHKTIGVV